MDMDRGRERCGGVDWNDGMSINEAQTTPEKRTWTNKTGTNEMKSPGPLLTNWYQSLAALKPVRNLATQQTQRRV